MRGSSSRDLAADGFASPSKPAHSARCIRHEPVCPAFEAGQHQVGSAPSSAACQECRHPRRSFQSGVRTNACWRSLRRSAPPDRRSRCRTLIAAFTAGRRCRPAARPGAERAKGSRKKAGISGVVIQISRRKGASRIRCGVASGASDSRPHASWKAPQPARLWVSQAVKPITTSRPREDGIASTFKTAYAGHTLMRLATSATLRPCIEVGDALLHGFANTSGNARYGGTAADTSAGVAYATRRALPAGCITW